MPHSLAKYFEDILLQISLIEEFTKAAADFHQYESNITLQYAVERALGIIGEALNKARKIDPTVAISHTREIIALRNIMVHAYDSVNNAVVWSILQNHLPQLKQEVRALLQNSELS